MSLTGKVAIVTGARGIGGACCRLLAERGAQVFVTYKQDRDAAEHLIADIRQRGGNAQCFQVDVLDTARVQWLIEEIVRTAGRIDILLSNAAVGWAEIPFEKLDWTTFATVVSNELKAAFDLTQATLPVMIMQQSGRLIYMASNLVSHTIPNTIASSTAKAGLTAFMRNIAAEYGRYGITANAIAPAMVMTEHNQYLPHAAVDAIVEQTPLRRIATPDDIAGVAAFLAGNDSGFITGDTFGVDGGKLLHA